MKLLKFNSVKAALILTIFYALVKVVLMSSLTLLVVSSTQELFRNVIFLVGLYFLQAVFYGVSEVTKYESGCYLKLQLNLWVDRHVASRSYGDYMKKDTGEYASLYVNDIPMIVTLLNQRFLTITYNIVLAIFIIIALYFIHWYMFIMGLLVIFFMYLTPIFFEKKLQKAILDSQDAKENFLYRISEQLQCFSVFFENSAFNYYFKKAAKICEDYSFKICKADKIGGILSSILDFISTILSLLSLTVLSVLVINETVSAGTLLSTLSLMPALSASVASIMTAKTFYQSGKSLFKSKFKNIEKKYDAKFYKPFYLKKHFKNDFKLSKKSKCIEINSIQTQNLIVHYEGRDIFINDCKFEQSKKYALVGASGCGKSTLLKTIIGEIENYDGEILVNGVEKSKNKNLLDYIGYVNQNVYLLNASLFENIVLERSITRNQVQRVLDMVGLCDFDLDYQIEENGKNLSGGQKQRIALARVLVEDKKIIFLDEATANLDNESALFIEELLLNSDFMIVMITHHLRDEIKSKINKIVYLDKKQ